MPPGAEEEIRDGLRRDGKSYLPRVDAVILDQRVDLVQRRLTDGWSGGDVIRAAMVERGVQKPQEVRYIRKA